MTYHAIIKDGGLFVPNIDLQSLQITNPSQLIEIDIRVVKNKQPSDAFTKAKGILNMTIDGVDFQNQQRADW